jgi:hypothetical protein
MSIGKVVLSSGGEKKWVAWFDDRSLATFETPEKIPVVANMIFDQNKVAFQNLMADE